MVVLCTVARIPVVNCGPILLCRTLAVAQCLTVYLADIALSMTSRPQTNALKMERSGASVLCRLGGAFFFAKRTEGFASSLQALTTKSICLRHQIHHIQNRVSRHTSGRLTETNRSSCARIFLHGTVGQHHHRIPQSRRP
jgi:hypothetical protein